MKHEDDLSPRQRVVWNVAAAVEIIGIFAFLKTKGDVGDPVIAGIAAACAVVAVLLTRKWVKDRVK